MALNYTGSGPGRFFRAWRYQRRRRLSVVNYVSVLCGFLAILVTFLLSYLVMAATFFVEEVAFCLPEEMIDENVEFIHEAVWSEYDKYPGRPWHVGYYICPEADDYTGFTVRYFSDAPSVKKNAREMYELMKKILTSRIREQYPNAEGVLRGRLVRGDISQAPGHLRNRIQRRRGHRVLLMFGNYPELRYEIWIGKKLLISESEASRLRSSTE